MQRKHYRYTVQWEALKRQYRNVDIFYTLQMFAMTGTRWFAEATFKNISWGFSLHGTGRIPFSPNLTDWGSTDPAVCLVTSERRFPLMSWCNFHWCENGIYSQINTDFGSKTASHDNPSFAVAFILWIYIVKSVKCTGSTKSRYNTPILQS